MSEQPEHEEHRKRIPHRSLAGAAALRSEEEPVRARALTAEVEALAARVDNHLKRMKFQP